MAKSIIKMQNDTIKIKSETEFLNVPYSLPTEKVIPCTVVSSVITPITSMTATGYGYIYNFDNQTVDYFLKIGVFLYEIRVVNHSVYRVAKIGMDVQS